MPATPRPLVELLTDFASAGRRRWRTRLPDVSRFMDLPALKRELEELGVVGKPSEDDQLDAFESAVLAAISAFPQAVREATELLFGFRDGNIPPLGKTARQGLAAEALGRSSRWLRTPNDQKPYAGATPHAYLIGKVASAIAAPNAEQQAAPAENDRAPDADGTDRPPPREARAADRLDPLASHKQIRRLYSEPTPSDVSQGFWWRTSTDEYLRQLAHLPRLTIYAGAEGHSDVGPPLHAHVTEVLLRTTLASHPLLAQYTLEEERSDEVAHRLVTALQAAYPGSSSWMGSIVAGLYRTRPGFTTDVTTAHLEAAVQKVSDHMSTTAFVSRPITQLAFALHRAGTHVAVISDHYDSDLELVGNEIRDELLANDDSASPSYSPQFKTLAGDDDDIPLINLHPPGRPLVGEGDYVSGTADRFGTLDDEATRTGLLISALSSSPTLFVGTSLTDPGIVAALAATVDSRHPRYALMLPPPQMRAPYADAPLDPEDEQRALIDRTLQLALIGARYLHLGVVPIFADFPYQVPQFVRELTLMVSNPDAYASMASRFSRWWAECAPLFGFPGPHGALMDVKQREVYQEDVYHGLRDLRISLTDRLVATDNEGQADERLKIEVWLRNPAARYLFRWGSSEAMWPGGSTAPRASLLESGTLTQEAFREGHSVWRGDPTEAQWQYCLAVNLVLQASPWNHLPIGVVKVYSSRADGGLRAVTRSDQRQTLEAVVKQRVRQLVNDAR